MRRPKWRSMSLMLITISMTTIILNWRQWVPSKSSERGQIYKDFPNMTLMVRTTSKPTLMKQFYCMFLRTVVLFWPPMYGDMILILDDNSTNDKRFGNTVLKQVHQHFPEYNFRVIYETLPKDPRIFEAKYKPAAYTRQLWSQFFSHTYTNEKIIAYMDTDVLLLTPLSKETLMDGNRLKVFGYGKIQHFVVRWENTTLKALGLPLVVNFMITFPQLIYRDTYIKCKQHIMRHLNTTDFEKAFSIFHPKGTFISPVNILLSYAWFYEKDSYDWHLKIPNLSLANGRLPEGHKIQPEDTIPALVPVAHVSVNKTWLQDRVKPGYCLSMTAQGQVVPGCEAVKHNLNRICNFHERVFHSPWKTLGTWCRGMQFKQCCEKAVSEHYEHVRQMASIGVHTVHRRKAELVAMLAGEMGVTCEPLDMP